MKNLTTRGPKAAQAILDRKAFKTNGALRADALPGTGFYHSGGWLLDGELEQFKTDQPNIDYVVFSYDTPIAWHVSDPTTADGRWYRVSQKLSPTTSKHMEHLYLI